MINVFFFYIFFSIIIINAQVASIMTQPFLSLLNDALKDDGFFFFFNFIVMKNKYKIYTKMVTLL